MYLRVVLAKLRPLSQFSRVDLLCIQEVYS